MLKGGTDILRDASVFRDAVVPRLDAGSAESKLLVTGCDDEFVGYFAVAVEARSPGDLTKASEYATKHLAETYVLDAGAAASVAGGISAGCADFLGISPKGASPAEGAGAETLPTPKSRWRAGAVAIATIALAVALAAAASHFVPLLGCTVLPSSGVANGVEYSWYKATSGEGKVYTLAFVRNVGDDCATLSSSRRNAAGMRLSLVMSPGQEGLAILEGDGGMDGVDIVRRDSASLRIDQLCWRLEQSPSGSFHAIIERASDDTPCIAHDCVLAKRGATAGAISVPVETPIRPGANNAILNSGNVLREGIPVGDGLTVDADCELYVNGVKVPRS